MSNCSVDECLKPIDRKGMCGTHYMRFWRNGTTDIIRKPAKKFLEHTGGYIIRNCKGHYLADKKGYLYEHRYTYYEKYGNGPFHCHWCDKLIEWDFLHIDHLNDEVKDNRIGNLVASCPVCNQQRGRAKNIATWRKKTGVEYKGKIYSMEELAAVAGMSRASLLNRLKTMSLIEAVETPKGNTGPKPRTYLKAIPT